MTILFHSAEQQSGNNRAYVGWTSDECFTSHCLHNTHTTREMRIHAYFILTLPHSATPKMYFLPAFALSDVLYTVITAPLKWLSH